ncbi:ABC transporter permease subunit [Butyrivibrio proteoclasticus]|uniref:ABC transporter permease subunit n=1 Tax=Butyrivibrio proteoclasticus TaxID=43305 RepID=UPI00047AD730|nr:ABC transporter permease subunit [Butyrivibrio proteoclasticus]
MSSTKHFWESKKFWYSIYLFALIVPFLVLVFLFSYYPLYGWRYAFYDYKPPKTLDQCAYVGFKWFKSLVDSPVKIGQIVQVLKNTFAMSGLTLGTSWLPMIFAVFLNEIRGVKFRKFVQTATTLPNFVSWVMVYSIAFCIFNSTGAANTFLMKIGVLEEPILFLQSSEHVWFTQWLWLTWKNLGWAAIMYIAAISSIDDEMIQAAKVDGASRMQVIWHITIPSLLPTYFVLLVINVANFLNNGMEQYYVFSNPFNKEFIQVLDLYVFNLMSSGGYPVSVAVSMLKSLVSLVLLIIVNGASKKIRGESIL